MAAKNDILRDKDGNQIFPATTAEQVSFDGNINVKQAIKRGAVRNKVAPTVASMTDKEQIYVYTGTEDGYTFGNWYYWNGTAWTSGGAYNAVEVNTDGTLTEEGAPADAKATGLRIDSLKSDLDEISYTDESFEMIEFTEHRTGTIAIANGTIDSAGSNFHTLIFPLNCKEIFITDASMNWRCPFYVIVDENSSPLIVSELAENNSTIQWIKNRRVALPTNAKYLYLNFVNTSGRNLPEVYDVKKNREVKMPYSNIIDTGVLKIDDKTVEILNASVLANRGKNKSAIKFNKKIGEQFGIRMKIKFPNDVHSTNGTRIDFLTIHGRNNDGNTTLSVGLYKQKTTVYPHAIGTCPVPRYNAKIGTSYNDDDAFDSWLHDNDGFNNIFKGENPMSIRFIGDCTSSVNQDICLIVDNTNITIKHEKTDETIKSYAKRDYETLLDLYNQMLLDTSIGGDLENFELSLISISGYTPDDIIPCKVYLVNQYYTDNAKTTTRWDSFPYYFTTKEKDRIYSIDFLLDKNCSVPCQLVIDGYGLVCGRPEPSRWESTLGVLYNNNITITIGNADAEDNGGIEIISFELLRTPKASYPNMRICYAENVHNGVVAPSGYYNPSTEKTVTENAKSYIVDNNFTSVKLQDMIDIVNSNGSDVEKLYHFSHDDSCVNVMTDSHLRNVYIANGIIPSFGLMLTSLNNLSENEIAIIKSCSMNGWELMIHTMSDGYAGKDIVCYSYDEMVQGIDESISRFVELFGIMPTIWDFHHDSENYNVVELLKTKGFRFIFGGNGIGGVNKITRYRCKRWQVFDGRDSSQIAKTYDTYLNTVNGVN